MKSSMMFLSENQATLDESVDNPEEMVTEPQTLDMVIRNDFSKYMIDQRASLVPTNSSKDKSGYLTAPAIPSFIHELKKNLLRRVLVRANVPSVNKMKKGSTKPFIKLELELIKPKQEKIYFTILFEESLLKFLPQDPECYASLYASFASTSMDKFLFIQFSSINLQIRTLLLTRDQDLKRIFAEKSFFAVASSTSKAWMQNYSFEINQVLGARLRKNSISLRDQDLNNSISLPNIIITVRDVARNQFFEKDNYKQLFMDLEDQSGTVSFYLYCHVTYVKNILSVFAVSRDTSVECMKNNTGYSIDIPGGEKLNIKEISIIQDLPINLLRSSTFIIRKDIQESFSSKEFFITKQMVTAPTKRDSGSSVDIECPFPSRYFKNVFSSSNQNYDLLLNHFLTNHKDFSKVIMNQLRRHQEKKREISNSCPFENCGFTCLSLDELEKHYGMVHKIGQIVFLQFSLANKWKIESFKQIGFISPFISSLVQCSHCFEVMTRQQLARHIAKLQ